VKYELRYGTGNVYQWDAPPALTPAQRAAVLRGQAELVRVNDRGQTELLDVDEITEVSPDSVWLEPTRPAAVILPLEEWGPDDPPFPTESPLLSIRVTHSESPVLHQGTSFRSISDFDAALHAARATPTSMPQSVFFCITWRAGATFQSSIALFSDPDEDLGDHIHRVCEEVLRDPTRQSLASAARLTIVRAFLAAVVEATARIVGPSPNS
jgi:hypothetical protein